MKIFIQYNKYSFVQSNLLLQNHLLYYILIAQVYSIATKLPGLTTRDINQEESSNILPRESYAH